MQASRKCHRMCTTASTLLYALQNSNLSPLFLLLFNFLKNECSNIRYGKC